MTYSAANTSIEHQACVELAKTLGCLPLALNHAGAYIHTQNCSFTRYLDKYKINKGRFLQKGWNIEDPNKSVFSTLRISLLAIQKENPTAIKLFYILGFLHNEDICEELLRLLYDGEQDSLLDSGRI